MELPADLQRDRSWTFHLTPAAPGCAGVSAGDARRNRMDALTPLKAMRALLSRLRIVPEQVRVQTAPNGDVEVIRVIDATPLAFVWHGATAAELNQVIRFLMLDGWRPRRIEPLPAPLAQPNQPELAA